MENARPASPRGALAVLAAALALTLVHGHRGAAELRRDRTAEPLLARALGDVDGEPASWDVPQDAPIRPVLPGLRAGGFVSGAETLPAYYPPWAGGTVQVGTAASPDVSLSFQSAGLTLATELGGPTWEPLAVAGELRADGSLEYEGVHPGMTERFRAESGVLKHELEVGPALVAALPPGTDALVLSWWIDATDGADAPASVVKDGGGGLLVLGAGGESRFWLPRPTVVHAGPPPAGTADFRALTPDPEGEPTGPPSPRLALELAVEPAGARLLLRLPAAVLEAAREATVTIDPTVIDLSVTDASTVVHGGDRADLVGDRAGLAVGDLNDDGALDWVVGAARADGPADDRRDAGEVHVLFGPFGPGETFDLAGPVADVLLVGGDRFDAFGWSLAVGDLDGDGDDDLLVGSPFEDGPDDATSAAGAAHVFLGPLSSGTRIDLSSDEADLTVHGRAAGHRLGHAVHAADVTGDGVDDVLVTARGSDGPFGGRPTAGAAFVVAGRAAGPAVVDLATRRADVEVHGAAPADLLGAAVHAGDLTGDGAPELLVSTVSSAGAGDARPAGGEVVVLLGPLPVGLLVDLAVHPLQAVVHGARAGDALGQSLDVFDADGDGTGDLVAGAPFADGPDGARDRAGLVAVIRGPFLPGRVTDLAFTPADVTVHGAAPGDLLGWSVDGAQSLLAVSALSSDGTSGDRRNAGEVVLLDAPHLPPGTVDLALHEPLGRVRGARAGDQLGGVVVVADLSGDGQDELATVAKTADGPAGGRASAGGAFLAFLEVPGCRGDAECDDGVDCTLDACDAGECVSDDAPCNAPPTCEPGAVRPAGCTAALLLDVRATDPDGDAMTYEWTSGDGRVLVEPASGSLLPRDGPRRLPATLVSLKDGVAPCGVDAELTLRVSDGRGGTAECTLRVAFRDEDPPLLTQVPEDAVLACGAVPEPVAPLVSDGCDEAPVLELVETEEPGRCPGERRVVRTWHALDACGNASSAIQVVTIVDEQAPVITPDETVVHRDWAPSHRHATLSADALTVAADDACSGPVTWRLSDCLSSQPDDGSGDGATTADCVVAEDGSSVRYRVERSGSTRGSRLYTLRAVATDPCDNESAPTVVGRIEIRHDQRSRR